MSKEFVSSGHGARRISPRKLTALALLLALMVIFAFTPLGFISIAPGVAVTLLHIPVLVGLLMEGFGTGVLLGLLFGLLSLIRALTPVQPLDALFINPLISVLPRLCVPCVAWAAYRGALALGKGRTRLPVAWAVSAFAGSAANTVLVLGMLYLVYGAKIAELMQIAHSALLGLLGGIALTNGVAEAIFAALVTPVLLGALTRRRKNLPGIGGDKPAS